MALPKIISPIYELILPSNKSKVQFRPFLTKEEKILLMSVESRDEAEIFRSMKQVVQNCILTDLKVETLPLFDLEYIFIQLRAKSVGEILESKYMCKNEVGGKECGTIETIQVPLEKIEVLFPSKDYSLIKVTDTIGIKLKYPTFEIMADISDMNSEPNIKIRYDKLFAIIGKCVNCIYEGEEIFTVFTDKEITEFLESLPKSKFEQIEIFLDNIPTIKISLPFVCHKCGYKETITIEGLESFFD
jgi:hypothetical protein